MIDRDAHLQLRSSETAFEDFVKRPQWADLPFRIKLALIHVWRAEREERPAASSME